MPRNLTTGIFTRVSNSFSNPVYGTVIDPTDADSLFDDYDGGMTFNDSEPLILIGSSSGITTIKATAVASGTITIPAATDTLVGRATTDTLTNKTLTSPVLTTPSIGAATGTSLALGGATLGSDVLAVNGSANIGTGLTVGNSIAVGSGQFFAWNGRSILSSPANGQVLLSNTAVSDFSRLQFGGVTSSFPALKRNATGIDVRLSDDSGYAPIAASTGTFSGAVNKVTITTPATGATLTIPDGVTLTGPAASGTAMTLGNAETVSGAKSFNDSTVILKGSASGAGTLKAPAAASTYVWTLPAATDTLVGKATTDTLTNKTFDTAGTGNSFSINGVAATANTGTGAVVRASSPTLTTPNLGTPSAITLTSGTGLPISTGVSGLGTGIATALAVNVGTAGAPVINGGALGTPSSGTLTNATGLPVSTGISGLGTGVATALTVAVGSAGAPVINGGALGTPSSGTLTNATGLPVSTGVSGLGTGVATALAVNVGTSGAVGVVTNGTFTPAITFGGAATGVTYSAQDGIYQQIGKVVTFSLRIVLTSKGTSTGLFQITGLPVASGTFNTSAVAVQVNNFAAAAITTIQSTVNASDTKISMQRYAAGVGTNLQDTDLTDTATIRITGTYFTA